MTITHTRLKDLGLRTPGQSSGRFTHSPHDEAPELGFLILEGSDGLPYIDGVDVGEVSLVADEELESAPLGEDALQARAQLAYEDARLQKLMGQKTTLSPEMMTLRDAEIHHLQEAAKAARSNRFRPGALLTEHTAPSQLRRSASDGEPGAVLPLGHHASRLDLTLQLPERARTRARLVATAEFDPDSFWSDSSASAALWAAWEPEVADFFSQKYGAELELPTGRGSTATLTLVREFSHRYPTSNEVDELLYDWDRHRQFEDAFYPRQSFNRIVIGHFRDDISAQLTEWCSTHRIANYGTEIQPHRDWSLSQATAALSSPEDHPAASLIGVVAAALTRLVESNDDTMRSALTPGPIKDFIHRGAINDFDALAAAATALPVDVANEHSRDLVGRWLSGPGKSDKSERTPPFAVGPR